MVYDTTVDPSAANTSHAQMLDLVGTGRSVLDVGCATGYLAQALAARGCTVSGIEYDADAAEKARQHMAVVVVGDLHSFDFATAFPGELFDALVFGDILEHLLDPAAVLRSALAVLAPGGSVVISVPNVTHGSLRLAHLQGRWRYTETGLLDRTHIRFFTRRSLHDLLTEAGLVAADVRETMADPLGVEVEVNAAALPPGVLEWVREQPDALVYQFVVRAVRDDGSSAEQPYVARDALTEQLTLATAEAARLRSELDRARAELSEIQATRAWRALAVLRAACGRLRTALGGTR